jgi:hypothetical protein
MRLTKFAVASFTLALAGCDYLSQKYAAEVGYYHGGEVAWDLWGDFKSLDECRDAAIARYNFYVSEKRGYSWSCLLKNGNGGYTSRHR